MKDPQKLFFQLLRIRSIELAIARHYEQGQIRCPVHLSIGQEAGAVAISAHLTANDRVVSHHRAHAHYLAKGGSLCRMIAELYGKETGCSRGQGGSTHLIDRSVGFEGSTAIVGGTIPVGVGMAFASSLHQDDRICVIWMGDAAVEEGVFHESLNFAALHELRVLFVCENNLYSTATHIEYRQPARPVRKLAEGHGIKNLGLDGNDLFGIHAEMRSILDHMRGHSEPVFVELATYRLFEHCGPNRDESASYRRIEDVHYWKTRDPVDLARSHLNKLGLWTSQLEESWQQSIDLEISHVFTEAAAAPAPSAEQLGSYTYVD